MNKKGISEIQMMVLAVVSIIILLLGVGIIPQFWKGSVIDDPDILPGDGEQAFLDEFQGGVNYCVNANQNKEIPQEGIYCGTFQVPGKIPESIQGDLVYDNEKLKSDAMNCVQLTYNTEGKVLVENAKSCPILT